MALQLLAKALAGLPVLSSDGTVLPAPVEFEIALSSTDGEGARFQVLIKLGQGFPQFPTAPEKPLPDDCCGETIAI